ncbi:unnamed protein product [Durusdinium trenchii]|uniref:Uncharacterized protein n=1 Tax=Durusdinium trenchii TaxID=1381693 RepID=A0ABP0Q0P6_9DINO
MFDWDDVPDDIANYVAVEQLSSEEETTEVQPAAEPAKEEQRLGYELDGVTLAPSECTSSLVPMDDEEFSSAELETVRWMMQKVLMRQDMFLLGPPGSHLFCTALKTLTEA